MASAELVHCLCFVALLCHMTFASKELEGFQENVTVDFNSGNILAEIILTNPTKSSVSRETGSRLTTTTTKSAHTSLMDGDLVNNTELTGPRLGRVIETSTPNSSQATQIETPPRIKKPSSQMRVIVPETQQFFTYQCEADGFPKPSYLWYRNDQQIDSTGEYIRAFDNGSLHLRNFTSREQGYFQCRAKNKYGTSVSVKLPIVMETPPMRLPDTPTEVVEVNEGEPAALYCVKTPPTVPEYITRWYLEGGTKEVRLNERIGTDSNGTLRFVYTEPSDSLNYICSLAPQSAGSQHLIRFYNKVKLEVRPKSKENLSPKKEFASDKVKAQLEKTVTLECFFSGYPIPSIRWQNKINQNIAENTNRFQITDHGRQLVIKNVREDDEGPFTCTAQNSVDSAAATIQVNVTSPPLLIINNDGTPSSLSSMTVPDQRDVTLHCKSRATAGETTNKPEWYRNGETINKSNLQDRYSFNDARTELTIRNLIKDIDTACFQCNITNSEGYLFFDGYLRVIESIKIYRKPNQSISLLQSEELIDLRVSATADSCCTLNVLWYFNGTQKIMDELLKPPFFNYSNDGNLFLNRSSVSEEELAKIIGNYTFIVSNSFQSINGTFQLYISAPAPTPVAEASSGSNIWWVILLCGLLAIIIAVAVVVIIIKSNYPRDTYPLEKTELKHHLNPEEDLLNHSFQEI